jgi:hypothetical protein
VEFGFPSMKDLLIPPGFCLMNQNLLMDVLNLRFRRRNWAPNV